MSYFEDVRDFHIQILGVDDAPPRIELPVAMTARVEFMEEEIEELGLAYCRGDLVGVADALADLVYVALGTAHMMGIPFDEVWAAVHKANMKKLPGPTKRGMTIDAMKPADWIGPEIEITAALYRAAKQGA